MKKLLFFILLFVLVLASCKEDPVVPPSVTVSVSDELVFVSRGESASIKCSVDSSDLDVTYQWYCCSDEDTSTGVPVSGAIDSVLVLSPFTEAGIYYYYCKVEVSGFFFDSDVVSVSYTGLPTVYINTPHHASIRSKDEWMEGATIRISGASDESWNFSDVTMSVKGRGNTTWIQPKKPYAIKLDKKKSIMGMPKSKRWVLIANYLDNSFMKNSMAFYLSRQFGMDYTVRGEFVDLVLNGKYMGLYWLGEAIKVDSNRVDIDEDNDYLIELDNYYDETWKFKSSVRRLPYMIKNDDSMDVFRLSALEDAVAELENLLYPEGEKAEAEPDSGYLSKVDIDSFIKFWFVNELMGNDNELGHPKSCFLTYTVSDGVFRAGPVWDFDWSTLHIQDNCRCQDTLYYDALFRSPVFKARVKELWDSYSGFINVDNEIEKFRAQIKVAAQSDFKLWGIHRDPSFIVRDGFDAYVDFVKLSLNAKMEVVDDFVEQL